MSQSFEALKKNSASELNKLTEALTKLDSSPKKQNGPDDRIWKPDVDKHAIRKTKFPAARIKDPF